jgi:hypothetical protein
VGIRAFTSAKTLFAIALAAGAVGALAGCGGSDDEATAGDAATEQVAEDTRPQWLREAERLCSEAEARYQTYPNLYPTGYTEVAKKIARNERALAGDLQGLEVPKGKEASLDRLTSLLERQAHEVDEANRIYSALTEEGTFEEYKQHVKRASALNAPIETAGDALGAEACVHAPLRTKYL